MYCLNNAAKDFEIPGKSTLLSRNTSCSLLRLQNIIALRYIHKKIQSFCVAEFVTLSEERMSSPKKFFSCLKWVKELYIRKFGRSKRQKWHFANWVPRWYNVRHFLVCLPGTNCNLLHLYTYLQNKRMRRGGVPPPPPPIIFERLKLLQQIIYRRKENLSESPNHQKYWENILVLRFYEQFSRNRRNLGHFRKFKKISNS